MSDDKNFELDKYEMESGNYLFKTDQNPDNFYRLWWGEIEICRGNDEIFTISEKDYPIGAGPILLNTNHYYSAVAKTNSIIKEYSFNQDDLKNWLTEHPVSMIQIIRSNSKLLTDFNETSRKLFNRFRELRPIFEPIIRPLTMIIIETNSDDDATTHSIQNRLHELHQNNSYADTINHYREIIRHIGRSSSQTLKNLSIKDELKNTFRKGEFICKEGESDEQLFILIQGSLAVLKDTQRIATIDQAGSIFGEMAGIMQTERTASIQADSESIVAILPFHRLPNLFDSSPDLAHKIVMTFLSRVENALELNYNLQEFIDGVSKFNEGENLSKELKEYLNDIVSTIDTNSDTVDDSLQNNANKLRPWSNNLKTLDLPEEFKFVESLKNG